MYSHYWFCGNFSLALYLIIYLSPCSLLVLLFQDVCHEFLPLNGNHFTIFVCGNTQHGVVGLQGALITCFTSDYQVHTCEHVTKVTESEEGMEHEMPDFLVDFFAERNYRESTLVAANTSRKEWKIRPVSWNEIPFQLSTTQKEIFSTLENVLHAKMSPTGLVLLTPSLPPSCPKCSSQCIDQPRKSKCGNVKVRNSLYFHLLQFVKVKLPP